jgi:23S rRNA pseudouridine1911/1915/1917 synthase
MGGPAVSDVRTLPVPEGLAGMRVDAGLARLLGLSRTVVAGLTEAGVVLLDGSPVSKSDRLAAGSWLEVTLPEPARPTEVRAEPVPGLRVLHDDADLVVVDKPVGVAAHPSPGWSGPTVLEGLAAAGIQIAAAGPAERHGVVHRLDVGTSGLMAVAKSSRGYSALKRAFRDRSVAKHYRALVQGHPDPTRGTIDAPIARHPQHDWRFAVVEGGKPSVTHYEVIEAFPAASLCEVTLQTGRTHQIRVHFAALRHPCCGDLTYGADPALAQRLGLERQWLHAARLGFPHPADDCWVEFTSPDPEDLRRALDVLAAQA